jgi:hypothetical protein
VASTSSLWYVLVVAGLVGALGAAVTRKPSATEA